MAKAEVRLEVKLKRSLGWLHMHLPWIAWGKRYMYVNIKEGGMGGGDGPDKSG